MNDYYFKNLYPVYFPILYHQVLYGYTTENTLFMYKFDVSMYMYLKVITLKCLIIVGGNDRSQWGAQSIFAIDHDGNS